MSSGAPSFADQNPLQGPTAPIWTRRLRTGHAQLGTVQPQLEAALYGRVLRTLRAWLGEPQLTVELTMIGPEKQRRIVHTADGVEVSLPFSWLSDVWMRGLAVTFGRLCIAADTTDGSRDRKSTRLNSSHLGISYAV